MYLSNKLIDELEKDTGLKFTLCSQKRMQKTIRDYFIQIHEEACDSTIMAINKKNFKKPNFEDK